MVTRREYEAFKLFREWAGYSVPPGRTVCAWELVKAERAGCDAGLTFEWEHEWEQWDGDCPAPVYLMCCLCRDASGVVVASLGMVGVNSLDDPYLRVVEAELASEALDMLLELEAATVLSL